MEINFPASPSAGDSFSANGRTYTYGGWAWELTSNIAPHAASHAAGGADAVAPDARWDLLAPAAPTALTAAAGNAQAVLAWTAPSGLLAQTPITDYVVHVSTDGTTWTTFSDGTSTAATATVTGLTNGTAYQFRVAAVNGIGTGAYSTASAAATPAAGDALFASVSLLMHMDGTNGSSTFTDSSLYATAGRLTRQGNAQISTAQSQFGSASGLFGGASDWVTTPTDSTLTLGSGDCTLEFFFRSGNTSSRMGVVGNRTGSGGDAVFCVVLNPANLYGFGYILMHTDNSAIISTATSWSANAWHYCAIVRSGSAWSLYLDGTRVGTATSSVDLNATSTLYLGKEGSRNDQSSPMDGNIDELRITQGHARYTGATMTVPTAAYPSSGVYQDPFLAKVSILLPMDGTGASFSDSSLAPKTITAAGDATQSAAQSKWGGKSAYFDGTGDSLSTGATADTLLGQSGDFTVEMWIYPTSLSGTRALFSTRTNSSSNDVIIFGIRSASVYVDTNAVGVVSEGVALTLNAWQHVALTRSGNTFTTYINGTVVATGSGSHSFSSAQSAIIGAEARADAGSASQFAGYIDDVRITKGVARTITVPTAAFPNS